MFVSVALAIGWVYTMPGPFLPLILDVDRLKVTIWLVPLLIGNALAASVVGLLLGPMYPIYTNEARKVLPSKVLPGSIGTLTCVRRSSCSGSDQDRPLGWTAGFGTAGSAILQLLSRMALALARYNAWYIRLPQITLH